MTHKLLAAYGMNVPLVVCNEHTEHGLIERIMQSIAKGEAVGLVSDAGTPLISDPGAVLVKALREKGTPVYSLPGANAAITALTLSGLAQGAFTFLGFLPPKSGTRKTALQQWVRHPAMLVCYERGSRVPALLQDALAVLGNREVSIARELTKLHEDVQQGELESLVQHYAGDAELRGEFVVMVAPATVVEEVSDAVIDEALRAALQQYSLKDAAQVVAEHLALPRKQVYARALELRNAT